MRERWADRIPKIAYVVALCGPMSSVPQMWEIWWDRNASGVSLVTWTLFLLTSVVWLLYGVVKRDRPLIISNSLWVAAEAIIMAGAFLYDVDLL
jgi:MtN3 and saliva related transmembrane protein